MSQNKTQKQSEEKRLAKGFPITSVARQDLLDAGFSREDVLAITDEGMKLLAMEMADAYCGEIFSSSLEDQVGSLFNILPVQESEG